MILNHYIQKMNRNIQDYGFHIFLTKVLSTLFSTLYVQRTYRIYFFDLSESPPGSLLDSKFNIRLINSDEEEPIRQIEKMTEWLKGQLKKKLVDGDMCLCALDNGTVAGFNLITFNKIHIPLLQMKRVLKSKSAWSEQISVIKIYRKQGLASALRIHIIKILQESGYTRLFGGALISNKASLNLAKKIGFEMLVDITVRRIFFIKIRTMRRVIS